MAKVWVELSSKDIRLPFKKVKLPGHTSVGKLICILRKRCKRLKPEEAMFLFFSGSIQPMNRTLLDISTAFHQSPVLVEVVLENTFGGSILGREAKRRRSLSQSPEPPPSIKPKFRNLTIDIPIDYYNPSPPIRIPPPVLRHRHTH